MAEATIISSRIRAVFWYVLVALALAGAACSARETPVPDATLALIPATATATATPVTPTATRAILPGPADVITPSPAGPVLIPAIAQPLIQRAIDDLSERQGVLLDNIKLVRLESAVWTTIDLGCGDEPQAIEGDLEIEGFRVILSIEGQTYEYHTDARSSVRLCAEEGAVFGTTEDLLLETDPVAAGLVSLAQRRLAAELGLATRRIQVVDVAPYEWTDSSLGCPMPGQSYAAVLVEGYRIVLSAGEEEYIYHSDSEQLVACDSENEQLPE